MRAGFSSKRNANFAINFDSATIGYNSIARVEYLSYFLFCLVDIFTYLNIRWFFRKGTNRTHEHRDQREDEREFLTE